MTKNEIRQLSRKEQIKLSNLKKKNGNYTALALFVQEILWEDSWASVAITNEPNPFDYEPFSIED